MLRDLFRRLRAGFNKSEENREDNSTAVQAITTRMKGQNADRLERVREKHVSAAYRSKRSRRRKG